MCRHFASSVLFERLRTSELGFAFYAATGWRLYRRGDSRQCRVGAGDWRDNGFERSLKRSLAAITQRGGNNSSAESSDARVPGVRSKTARSSGWLEKARNASRIVLASPFAHAYSELRETREQIELRGLRASRGVAVFAHASELSSASQSARVLSSQEWEEKMAKQSNGDPQDKKRLGPTTSKEKEARLKEIEKLGTRGMLLMIMEMLGDELVSDDQLRRALIILEALEP